MRLFTAIDVPSELKTRLHALQFGLDGAKWHEPNDFHLTLCFIGDLPKNSAEELVEELTKLTFKPQKLVLTELSFFGSTKPRSLHIRVKENVFLSSFVKKQERILEKLGLNVEKRAFLPHITLASLQKGVTPFEVTRYIEERRFQQVDFTAENFSLLQGKDGGGAPYVKVLM